MPPFLYVFFFWIDVVDRFAKAVRHSDGLRRSAALSADVGYKHVARRGKTHITLSHTALRIGVRGVEYLVSH